MYRSVLRVAIYCRLSEEDRNKKNAEDESLSIQNQKSMLLSYALEQGWDVYKIYSDEDYTGADRNRPDWNELLKDAEAKKFDIVLCKSQSRFTREMEMVEKYLHDLFPIWGIRFIGLVDNADTTNKGNKKQRQINGLVNEWYLEDLSENIKDTLTDRRRKGFHIGAFAPYGYLKDPDLKGHLIPDPIVAPIVHRIFEMFAAGTGKMKIARILNAEGIPNPTEYKRQQGIRWRRQTDSERSGLWQYFTIADILINEVYIGNLVQGKYESISYKTHKNKPTSKDRWIRVENTHEPIIERELWNKVQTMIAEKSKPGWNGEVGLFARKAKCMYCGYIMASSKTGDGRKYLKCSSKKIHIEACKGGFIGQNELQDIVLAELKVMITTYLDMDEATKQLVIIDETKKKKEYLKKELHQVESKLKTVEKSLKILYQDRVMEIISLDEYLSLSAGFKRDMELLQDRMENVRNSLEQLENIEDSEKVKRELLEQFADIRELNYDIVNSLIDHIEVGRREGHYKKSKVPVCIHWKF